MGLTSGWRASLCLIALSLLCLNLGLPPLQADGPTLYSSPLDRFGVLVVRDYGDITDYDVGRLRASWYADWWFRANPPRPHGMKFMQTITASTGRSLPDSLALQEDLGRAVDANPGSIWLVGNEPDVVHQDNCTPGDYAKIYHDVYWFIKGRDPTAQLSAAGIVQPTPLRIEWLNRVWQAYFDAYHTEIPVDVWNIHNQILCEGCPDMGCGIPPGIEAEYGERYTIYDNVSLDIFRRHIRYFREWMRARGERNKPLIISEYGVLMPSYYLGGGDEAYGDSLVKAYMTGTFTYLLTAVDNQLGCPADGNRLVQQWAWYSLNEEPYHWETGTGGFNGPLFDWRYPAYPGVITQFGLTYAAYTYHLAIRNRSFPLLFSGHRSGVRSTP